MSLKATVPQLFLTLPACCCLILLNLSFLCADPNSQFGGIITAGFGLALFWFNTLCTGSHLDTVQDNPRTAQKGHSGTPPLIPVGPQVSDHLHSERWTHQQKDITLPTSQSPAVKPDSGDGVPWWLWHTSHPLCQPPCPHRRAALLGMSAVHASHSPPPR